MANVTPPTRTAGVGQLLEGIGHDVRTIATDEIELARAKLSTFLEQLITKASAALLGATVALIGVAMLCMVVVLLLAPVIRPLWERLLLMALVYIGLGAAATFLFMRRMAAMHGPDLGEPIADAGAAVDAVEHGLEHS